jgi:hypothetical protein
MGVAQEVFSNSTAPVMHPLVLQDLSIGLSQLMTLVKERRVLNASSANDSLPLCAHCTNMAVSP